MDIKQLKSKGKNPCFLYKAIFFIFEQSATPKKNDYKDMEQKNIPYSLILTIIVTIAGYGVTFGVCKNQIDQNAKDITRVERQHENDIIKITSRQDNTDGILNSINSQLVELNTKMNLLLNGKLEAAK